MSGRGDDFDRGPGKRLGHPAGGPQESSVLGSHHETDRDLDPGESAPVARHPTQPQDAERPRQAFASMAEPEAPLGLEHFLRKSSLAGEQGQGLPIFEKASETFFFQEASQPLVGSAALAPLLLGFQTGRSADQRRRGEEVRVADEEAYGQAAALGVAGEVEVGRSPCAKPLCETVDLVFECGGGDGVFRVMAEDVRTEPVGTGRKGVEDSLPRFRSAGETVKKS